MTTAVLFRSILRLADGHELPAAGVKLTAVNIEESIRLNVCAMAVQVFIGGEFEKQSIINMTGMVGNRCGIPTPAVTKEITVLTSCNCGPSDIIEAMK